MVGRIDVNRIVPTAPSATSDSRAASTAFVTAAIATAVAHGLGPFITIANGTVVASVAASALTLAIKTLAGTDPSASDSVTLIFRNATTSLGNYVAISLTSALSVTIPSGATLGHVSARNQQIILYVINNAGTPELAVATPLSDLSVRLRSTTALTAGATSPSTLYSTNARASIPYYPLARCVSNQATAGTWAAVPTQIDLAPFTLPANACDIYLSNTVTFNPGIYQKVPYDTVFRDDDGVAVLGNNCIQPIVPGTYAVAIVGYTTNSGITEGNAGLVRNGQFGNPGGALSGGQLYGRSVSSAANQEAGGAVSSLIQVNGTSDTIMGIFAPIGAASRMLGFGSNAYNDLNHLTAIRVGP